MAQIIKAEKKGILIGRLDYGKDILEEITKICIENKIQAGKIDAIGALSKVCIGYYDQSQYKYEKIILEKELEIISLTGNISLKDEKPFAHLHASLSDDNCNVVGGHLFEGSKIFACEIIIEIFDLEDEKKLKRAIDYETKLPLWNMK